LRTLRPPSEKRHEGAKNLLRVPVAIRKYPFTGGAEMPQRDAERGRRRCQDAEKTGDEDEAGGAKAGATSRVFVSTLFEIAGN
jgi:hypothetical protein